MFGLSAVAAWRLRIARGALAAPSARRAVSARGLVGFGARHVVDTLGSHSCSASTPSGGRRRAARTKSGQAPHVRDDPGGTGLRPRRSGRSGGHGRVRRGEGRAERAEPSASSSQPRRTDGGRSRPPRSTDRRWRLRPNENDAVGPIVDRRSPRLDFDIVRSPPLPPRCYGVGSGSALASFTSSVPDEARSPRPRTPNFC